MTGGAGARSGRPALTPRGRAALALGLSAIVFSRLFGTQEVALLGAALVAATLLARFWVGRAGGPHVALRTLPAYAHAGDSIEVEVELRPLEGARSGRAAFQEAGGGPACALRPVTAGGLRVLRGRYELGPLTRGLCELGAATLVREDPFGLARRVDVTRGSTALTVLAPPLELGDGARAGEREAALSGAPGRGGGHDLHGVREHQPGESLRGVHWPATAHRGRLMVKELEEPRGDDLAVVLDARASAEIGVAPDSSFELAVSAAGALVARAHADGRRVRLIVAGAEGEPAGASDRAALRRLLARARPAGERPPGEVLARLAAERVEVVTSRPATLLGVVPSGRLGVIAIDPSSFDAGVPRDAEALAALRASGARVLELRREPRERAPLAPARRWSAAAARGAVYVLAVAFGLLHARDLQTPALATPELLALCALATAPALLALRAGRRLGALALVPATLAAAWIASGWPSPGAPLGGLGGRLLDAPSAWAEVVLPFSRSEYPELHSAVLFALFAWLAGLAWLWIARPRPLAAALLAVVPFALSATVYVLPQYPWRALLAGALLLAFLRSGRPAGGGAGLAAAFAALALAAGLAWAAVPAASQPQILPWTSWTFTHAASAPLGVDVTWDMRYQPLRYAPSPVEVLQVRASQPSYWRALVLSDFDGLRFTRAPQATVASGGSGGDLRLPSAPSGRKLRADVRIEAFDDSFLVAPGQPVRYQLPSSAGAVELGEDGTAQLLAGPAAGLEYVAEGSDPNPTAQALRALPADYPPTVSGGDLQFAGASLPPFGAPGRASTMAALFRLHAGDPVWSAWQTAYAKAQTVTRGAASPYQAMVALEAWLRTTRAYDANASLPDRPDALAIWAASGRAGHCQMFSAALAALARLSGVPARVAEGFVPGDLRDGTYHVTDRDAHAWVEAWFPGYGWLPFDATPGSDLPERASSSSTAFDGQAAQAQPAGSQPSAGLPRLQLPLSRLHALLPSGSAAGTSAGSAERLLRAALALIALVVLLAALPLAKRMALRRALRGDAARDARLRVSAFAADQGVELPAALTPRELAGALEDGFGVDAGAFAGALERSAYAPPGARDDAGLAVVTSALLRDLRSALRPGQRLRGALSMRAVRSSR